MLLIYSAQNCGAACADRCTGNAAQPCAAAIQQQLAEGQTALIEQIYISDMLEYVCETCLKVPCGQNGGAACADRCTGNAAITPCKQQHNNWQKVADSFDRAMIKDILEYVCEPVRRCWSELWCSMCR
jgi:hypothetical protein